MSDPTTARDRAIETVSAALGLAPYDDTGRTAVDALLSHPEVLRALVADPDVVASRAAIERVRTLAERENRANSVGIGRLTGPQVLRALDGDTTEEGR